MKKPVGQNEKKVQFLFPFTGVWTALQPSSHRRGNTIDSALGSSNKFFRSPAAYSPSENDHTGHKTRSAEGIAVAQAELTSQLTTHVGNLHLDPTTKVGYGTFLSAFQDAAALYHPTRVSSGLACPVSPLPLRDELDISFVSLVFLVISRRDDWRS